jgi:hypothetical protein
MKSLKMENKAEGLMQAVRRKCKRYCNIKKGLGAVT